MAAAAPVSLILVVGLAAPASAAVTVSGASVSSDAAGDSFSVSCVGGHLGATGAGATGDPCEVITQVAVFPRAGSDTVNLSGVTAAAFPALTSTYVYTDDFEADTVTGSPRDDQLVGDANDTFSGGDGNDMIAGADSATGGPGDDSLTRIATFAGGGEGDDRFVQVRSLDGVDGGPGMDSWEFDFDQASLGLNATADFSMSASTFAYDVRDDGVPANSMRATNLEQVFITLLRHGAQTYDGATFPGSQHVRGMAGPDTIAGGGSEDALYGGGGNDTVTGNGGPDILYGGDGDDTVNARDGVADRLDCGTGTDSAVADAIDVVVNCETVSLPPVAAPPAPPAPPVVVVPVTGAINGPRAVTKPKPAKFTFSSTTAGATFQCKVDAKTWKACTSPYKVATRKLKPGKHKLLVRAVVGGSVDATPSKEVFRVRRA